MATNDWLTLAEAKATLNFKSSNTSQDDLIQVAVTGLSERFDYLVGPVVQRSVTDERHDGGYDGGRPKTTIMLDFGPVSSVSSVVEYQGETAVSLSQNTTASNPTDGFLLDRERNTDGLYSGIVRRMRGPDEVGFWSGKQNIVVSYLAGRVADTDSIPETFKSAARVALKNWWRQYELAIATHKPREEYQRPHATFPTFLVPYASRELLRPYLRPEVGFGG